MNVHAMLSPMNDAPAAMCPPSPASSVASYSSSTSSFMSDSETNALKRGWVAPFLLHLHQMLRRENPKIIRWTDDGVAFQILDKDAMTAQILPRYFKNKNFASFQRQLNYFGFRKWSKARAQCSTYSREHFTRDNYGDMSLVKRQSKKSRKRPASAVTATATSEEEQDAKRVATSHAVWVTSDKCKPILPRPGMAGGASSETPSPVASPLFLAAPAPLEHMSPSWRAAPTTTHAAFTLPVISPTRKVASGCKLPSLQDLAFSRALSGGANARPLWLA